VRVANPPGEVVTLRIAGAEGRRLAWRYRRGGKLKLAVTVREFVGPRQGSLKIARTVTLGRSR
jgi:hypothetical protein